MVHIPADVLTAHLDGEAVLLDLDTRNYYRLNATAAHIWKALEAGVSPAQLVESVTAEFAVDRAVAESAIASLLTELESRRLVAHDED